MLGSEPTILVKPFFFHLNNFCFRTDEDDDQPVDEKGHADITIQGNILRVDRSGKKSLQISLIIVMIE